MPKKKMKAKPNLLQRGAIAAMGGSAAKKTGVARGRSRKGPSIQNYGWTPEGQTRMPMPSNQSAPRLRTKGRPGF
jgi:hypothetical protein